MSLTELLMTLAILAVLVALASPSYLAARRQSELATTVNALVGALQAARTEAMRRGHPALLRPVNTQDWRQGWLVFVDIDGDFQYSATQDVHVLTQPALEGPFAIQLTGTAADAINPYLMFDVNGYCRTFSGGFSGTTFDITRTDLSGDLQLQQTRRVIVASTGRVRSCQPSSRTDRDCRVAGS